MITASLTLIDPSGGRTRVPIDAIPFTIGRQAGNSLVLRDNRTSRQHARIVREGGEFFLEDLHSSHGIFVNGVRVTRHPLRNADNIEFGIPDSYRCVFIREGAELDRLVEEASTTHNLPHAGGTNLGKLRALVEVARSLQNSLSTEDVLASVVDAALTVTGSERGFLLLRKGEDLEMAVARDNKGKKLEPHDLTVPTRLIHRALSQRREMLSMNFDPNSDTKNDMSVATLNLRSVVCVPLVHVKTGVSEKTEATSTARNTIGLLYMDSRASAADLSGGNRELLQTLALEASTVIENARLLEQERARQRMEEELNVARQIQRGLLPRALPETGWFRAAGWSVASRQVGGDYFDVRKIGPGCWATVVADVSGKGVSSALLASLLQGAFLLAKSGSDEMQRMMQGINSYLLERTEGEKYATVFFSMLTSDGRLTWINAGHCPPILLSRDGAIEEFEADSLPVGMLEMVNFVVRSKQLRPGDRVVVYSDGISDAQNTAGEAFDIGRLRRVLIAQYPATPAVVADVVKRAVDWFTEGCSQLDDMTLAVFEYNP